MSTNAKLAIFRAGTHTSMDGRVVEFSADAIRELAESYDPNLSQAPLVIGHPKLDSPAWGWAKSLRADGELLYAEPHQVEPSFAELVNAGRYKNVSASIFLPNSPGNPTPGKHYLRHIGFLGATPPAVKGLPPVQFAAGAEPVEFASLGHAGWILSDMFQRIRDWLIERDGAEAADKIIPQWQIRSLAESTTEPAAAGPSFAAPGGPSVTEIAMTPEEKAALDQRTADVTRREQAIQERETAARRSDAVAFAANLVKEGKLLPRQEAQVVEVLMQLPADASLSFAEAEAQVTKPMGEVVRQLLTDMPVRIDFKEKSGESGAESVAFAAPGGRAVDAGRLEIHGRALAYQAQHPNTDYLDAVKAVGG